MRLLALLPALALLGCARGDDEETVKVGPKDPPPPDLRARKTGEDWPRFLGPRGDGTSAEKGLLKPWPAVGPRVVWHKEVGEGYSAPSVSRGRLFFADRLRNRQRLHCCNAETGESIWMFEYGTTYRDRYGYNGGARCCPVADGDRVYLYGPEGMLQCVRARDGKLAWKVDTRAQFNVIQNYFGVGSTPVVEGELLLASVGGSPKGSDDVAFTELKGNGSALVAFDKYTGKVKWKVGDELASYSSPVVATIGKARLCLLFARGGLLGVDVKTGKEAFRFPWRSELEESANASNPVVVGDKVFVTECYSVGGALLELKGGKPKAVWTDRGKKRGKSLACHWMTPIHVDGYLYGCSGRHKGEAELRCVELASGKVMWRRKDLTRCSLLLMDGHFVCLGEEGVLKLLKVNPRKYEELSSAELFPRDKEGKVPAGAGPLLKEPAWAAPVLSHGLMYLRGDDRLVCVELIPPKK